ncbi:hypothetical protein AAY473_012567 [Plecturocebus cupreus]
MEPDTGKRDALLSQANGTNEMLRKVIDKMSQDTPEGERGRRIGEDFNQEDGVSFCHLGQSTVVQSQFTATSSSQAQAVLSPQPSE